MGFEKVKLEGGLVMGEIIELAVLPDQKVLYINRGTTNGGGQVRLYNPATRTTSVVLTVPLDARFEDGLIGITLHPRFATTGWVYLFYSPKVTLLVNRISRFTFNRTNNTMPASTEDVLIEWPTQRDLCCHSAGSMSWDTAGNLYFAVGDNRANNTLYWADVGPDANATIPNRGPAAYDEFNRATAPGNYGWPYCGGPNVAYNDWDFAANAPRGWFMRWFGRPGQQFPTQHRTTQLLPTRPALVWEQHGGSREWPALDNPNGCGAPNHTEVYHFDPNLNSDVKWPQYYDNKWLISEYCRNWIKEVQFNNGNPATGTPTVIEPVLAGMNFVHPIDMEFGPDGSLYLLEYGSGYFSGAPDAGLTRSTGCRAAGSPTAKASVSKDNGLAPLTVSFSSVGSSDPGGNPLTYAWDFTNDGRTDSTAANPTVTYTTNGNFQARLTVNDGTGKSGTTTVPIVVGNDRPTLRSPRCRPAGSMSGARTSPSRRPRPTRRTA